LKEKIDPTLWVEPEKAPFCVARRSFGMTTLRFFGLDWRVFRLNSGEDERSTDPILHADYD